jgi:hypothetical protein
VSAPDERVTFTQDIKPLFRPVDHESMAWAFDPSGSPMTSIARTG